MDKSPPRSRLSSWPPRGELLWAPALRVCGRPPGVKGSEAPRRWRGGVGGRGEARRTGRGLTSRGGVDACTAAKALAGARLRDLPGGWAGPGFLAKWELVSSSCRGRVVCWGLRGPRALLDLR